MFQQIKLNSMPERSNLFQFSNSIPTLSVISAGHLADKKDKWIFFKKEVGTPLALSYSSFDSFDNNQHLLLPETNYTLTDPISIANNFYIFKVVSPYRQLYKLGIIEKVDKVTIEDTGRPSYFNIFYQGSHDISLSNLLRRGIKITLIQFKTEGGASQSIDITVGKETKSLTTEITNSVKFLDLQVLSIKIDNPYSVIVLEFQLSPKESFLELFGNERDQTSKLIYFKFTTEKHQAYPFGLESDSKSKTPSFDYKYFIGVGEDDFLSLPTESCMAETNVENPYNTNQPLLPNEFLYVSFQIPDDEIPYSFRFHPNSDSTNFLPNQTNTLLGRKINSFATSKNKTNTQLAIIVNRCTSDSYTMYLKDNKIDITSKSSTNLFEVFSYPNQYFSIDLSFSPWLANTFNVAYNYLTDTELKALETLSNKALFTFSYDESTTKITWSNPNDVFTEFHFYIKPAPYDLSNNCVVGNLQPSYILKTAEFSLKDNNLPSGKYKINILKVSTGKIDFAFAYQESTINSLSIFSVTDKPLLIDFASLPFGYYFDMTTIPLNEEGVIFLSFNYAHEQLGSALTFASKAINMVLGGDMSQFIPSDNKDSDFPYTIDRQYVRMYYTNKLPKTPNQQNLLFIGLKYPNIAGLTATILSVRVMTPDIIIGSSQIVRKAFEIQNSIPFLFCIKRTSVNPDLFMTEPEVILFRDSLTSDSKESLTLKEFNSSSSNTYYGEYFGPAQTVYLHFEKINGYLNVISSDDFGKKRPNNCNKESMGKSQYFIGFFKNVPLYNEYYLISNQQFGLVDAYYTNDVDIKGTEEKSILPSSPLKGPINLQNPTLMLRIDCKYPGESYTQHLKPTSTQLLDFSKDSYLLLFTKGNYQLPFQKNGGEKLEVNLLQLSEDNNIGAKVGTNDITLNSKSRIARFSITTETEISITNPSNSILLSFKLIHDLPFVKVEGDNTEQNAQFIYYPLAIGRAKTYLFSFDREIVGVITYALDKGADGFIMQPREIINTNAATSFSLPNPYATYQELQQDEFWYVSLEIPDKQAYRLLVKTDDPLAAKLLPLNTLSKLTETRHSLDISRDNSKSNLVIFVAQCKKIDYQLNFYYDSLVSSQKGDDSMRKIFTQLNGRVPLEMEYKDNSPSPSNAQYHLSYNYMSKEEADSIKSVIEGKYSIQYSNGNLTWDKPDTPTANIKLFITNKREPISNECEMLASTQRLPVEGNAYNLTANDFTPGKYVANVLIEVNDKLQYAIAYNEFSFEHKIEEKPGPEPEGDNTTAVAVGVSIGVIALLAIIFGVFLYRRKQRLQGSEPLMTNLAELKA